MPGRGEGTTHTALGSSSICRVCRGHHGRTPRDCARFCASGRTEIDLLVLVEVVALLVGGAWRSGVPLKLLWVAHKAALVLVGSLGNTMRGVVRNKERCKRRRTPTQDPSTNAHADTTRHSSGAPRGTETIAVYEIGPGVTQGKRGDHHSRPILDPSVMPRTTCHRKQQILAIRNRPDEADLGLAV